MTSTPEMTLDRALEITRAINARAFLAMGIVEDPKLPSLADVALLDMIEAASIVKHRNMTAPSVDGARTTFVVPADRLIAAVYVGLHFDPDATPISMEPRRFLGQWQMNAVAVVDVTTKADVEPEKVLA